MKYTIGIDPDSEKHGVAIYVDGKLETIDSLGEVEIVQMVNDLRCNVTQDIVFGIEDVMANQFIYRANQKSSKAAQSRVGISVGRCQQAQVSLMRWLDHLDVEYRLFKPQRGNWAEKKAHFERVTGWTARSNKDTRSAAFFGYLALGS